MCRPRAYALVAGFVASVAHSREAVCSAFQFLFDVGSIQNQFLLCGAQLSSLSMQVTVMSSRRSPSGPQPNALCAGSASRGGGGWGLLAVRGGARGAPAAIAHLLSRKPFFYLLLPYQHSLTKA